MFGYTSFTVIIELNANRNLDTAWRDSLVKFIGRLVNPSPQRKEELRMNTQIDMNTFNEMLKNESATSPLMMALKKLMEIGEPKSITEAKGPKPLGVWSGWSM